MTSDGRDEYEITFQRKYRHVKTGYVTAGALLVVSLVCFIAAIATNVGALAGIGTIFIFAATVALVSTVTYHNLSGVFNEQEKRQR